MTRARGADAKPAGGLQGLGQVFPVIAGGADPDVIRMLREARLPLLRWPGGNFVSGYDWRDGLGDRDKRPTRTNPAWTGIETNDMGMDEFITFCRLIDTSPVDKPTFDIPKICRNSTNF